MDFLTPAAIRQAIQDDDTKVKQMVRAAFRRSMYVWTKVAVSLNEPRNLMDADTFKKSCDWLQWVVCTKKRGLFEDPRGHIKTTRSTRSIPGWIAIQRPDAMHDHPAEVDRANEFLLKHPHLRGSDSRLVIGSDSKERASDFVGSTKTDWETNVIMRWAFPELLWENYNRLPYGEWSRAGYTLNGRLNPALPDPFITAVGLDSKVQGGRAEGIIIDDLVGETSYRSGAELSRRKAWAKTIGFLLENRDYEHPQGGFIMIVGNRWSHDDVNSEVHNEFDDWAIWHRSAYRCMVHGAENCGRWDDHTERQCADSDKPLWLGRYEDANALDRVEKDVGTELFAAQFRNDPTAVAEMDASLFRPCHLDIAPVKQLTGDSIRQWAVITSVYDSDGKETKEKEVIALNTLAQPVISIDPANSRDPNNARTAISWFMYDPPTGRVFWLACRADHWGPEEAVAAACQLSKEVTHMLGGNLPRILIEKVALQAYFGSSMKFYAQHHGIKIAEPEMIPPQHGVAKDDRIRRRTGNRLNQGLLYLCAGLQLPKWEVRHFPTGTKDTLDTHGQAEEIYLQVNVTRNSNRLAAARRRKRKMRLAAADRTGVPL